MLRSKLVDIATGVALTSRGVGKRNSFRIGAILFDKRKVLTGKPNVNRTHPALRGFTAYPFLHAESNCILSHGLDNCKGLDMLVVRVLKDNSLSCAEPCEVCKKVVMLAGIRRVYYSNWNGNISCFSCTEK